MMYNHSVCTSFDGQRRKYKGEHEMKKEMQKWLCGAGALVMCVMLAGCGHEHTWVEATCTESKTCSECGETEGEALGHTWVEATCAEAKHCSVCGETEGEALEHTLTEANYQQAATCEVCGQTVGEPLQADFEQYGCAYVSELDKEYPFVNQCNQSDKLTNGKITFSDYKTFTSDESHEELEGYEWKSVIYTIVFDDDNVFNYGYAGFGAVTGDYYSFPLWLEGTVVNYNGKEYSDCIYNEELLTQEWVERGDGTAYFVQKKQVDVRVPIGYDGVVISIMNHETREKLGSSLDTVEDILLIETDENTVNFRLM